MQSPAIAQTRPAWPRVYNLFTGNSDDPPEPVRAPPGFLGLSKNHMFHEGEAEGNHAGAADHTPPSLHR